MKLRNKKTGEIKEVEPITIGGFRSLAELNENWEDASEEDCELKKYWSIYYNGTTILFENDNSQFVKDCIEIGNYFETREEAEKAVEKLKAWKRLKDKGLRFKGYETGSVIGAITEVVVLLSPSEGRDVYLNDYVKSDLDLLFSGEDD